MLEPSLVIAGPDSLQAIATLFDPLPDVVFSARDLGGRFIAISQGWLVRHALQHKRQVLGRTVAELLPQQASHLSRYDHCLLREGRPLLNRLETTRYPDGSAGWCLSHKQPIRDDGGQLIGLASISRDLAELSRSGLLDSRFAQCVDHIQRHFSRRLTLDELCAIAGLSPSQLERRMRKLFRMSASEFIRQTRMEAASHAICHTPAALADIAVACGFCDQSALTRHCRQRLGLSPRQLRQRERLA
nr:helix-turn-helix domain-containing protein [Chromobacterium sp. ASV5]